MEQMTSLYNDPNLDRGALVYKLVKAARAGFINQKDLFYLKHLIRKENENAQRANQSTN